VKIEFSKKAMQRVEEIIKLYPDSRAAMLPILYLAEEAFGYISPEVEKYVAEILDVPPVKVHEVMTFYTLIADKRRGKYHFQVCRGLSCHLGGCQAILKYLSDKLRLKPGETSNNYQFTITEVECLGACETAPMMQLNEDYHGNLTPNKIDDILKKAD